MWTIELNANGRAEYYQFSYADQAEQFREAAQYAVSANGRKFEVTLWYCGHKFNCATNEIAHYYQMYTDTYVLYNPVGKGIAETHSLDSLMDWAKTNGINNVVYGRAAAEKFNKLDT